MRYRRGFVSKTPALVCTEEDEMDSKAVKEERLKEYRTRLESVKVKRAQAAIDYREQLELIRDEQKELEKLDAECAKLSSEMDDLFDSIANLEMGSCHCDDPSECEENH